jgi:hypothetical protein
VHDACVKCRTLGIECIRLQQGAEVAASLSPGTSRSSHARSTAAFPIGTSLKPTLEPPRSYVGAHTAELEHSSPVSRRQHDLEALLSLPPASSASGLGPLPTGKELEDLVQLYFSSVHREYLCSQVNKSENPATKRLALRLRLLCLCSPAPLQSPSRQG